MLDYPSGTVTFLFTDIEGSTKLAREHPEAWEIARTRHYAILRSAIESYDGFVFQIIGDAVCASFHKAGDALKAAMKIQQDLQYEPWGEVLIRVRLGIHTGEAETDGKEYRGYLTLSLVQRVMSAGHGGQILVSSTVENLLRDQLPKDVSLRDMGEQKFKDISIPVRVFQVVAPSLQSEFPVLRTLTVFPNNLPAQIANFVGREKEVADIVEALAENRLITIIGMGGTGKTRLAIEIGVTQVDRADCTFVNGVYFVALAPLETTDAIVPTIAKALGFSFYKAGEPRQQLLDYLREKSMLLILDNFEHLLSGVDFVTEILNTASQVKIIATSRARLNVQGEQLFHLRGMEFPAWETPADVQDYSAVKLFLQSAHRIHLDFELTSDNLKYITRICRLVEGMPLGILLAASWLEMLTPQEIADEIEKSLDFLETDQRDLPDRQQSLRAVFDHSWKLLTPGEQNVFTKASVFYGGFSLEAAQQVTGASLSDLMRLVDKSLLQRNPSGRYEIHELLRQYGAQKLAKMPEELEAIKNQHSAYFADYLHQRESALFEKGQKQAMIDIAKEIENIRAAWDWATSHGRVEDILHSMASLAEYHDIRSEFMNAERMLSTAEERLAKYLVKNQDSANRLLLARIQTRLGGFLISLGHLHRSEALIKTALPVFEMFGEQRNIAYALYYLGWITCEFKEKRAYFEQALNMFRKTGERIGEALSLRGLGEVAVLASEFELTTQLCQESLNIFQELGNERWVASMLDDLGYAYWLVGDYEKAKKYHQESPLLHKDIGNRHAEAQALNLLAIDMAGLKEFGQAMQLLQNALAIYREIGAILDIGVALNNMAEFLTASGDFKNAALHARESFLYTQDNLGYLSWPNRTLGEALVGIGDLQDAKEYLLRSLKIAQSLQEKCDLLLAIKAISVYFAAHGEGAKALELLAFVNNHPAAWQWTKDRATALASQLETELPPNVILESKERGRARNLDVTVAELLTELED